MEKLNAERYWDGKENLYGEIEQAEIPAHCRKIESGKGGIATVCSGIKEKNVLKAVPDSVKSATLHSANDMRKLVAIFMLAVFTFNIAGYQLVYNYLSHKSDKTLELALDADNYSDEDLLVFKQPTHLPYYNNSSEFKRIDGEVMIDGVRYKYVKCRVYNGNLEMLCIPNKAKMQIEQSKNDYAKGANDFQQGSPEKKDGSQKTYQKSISEYEEQSLITIDCGSHLISTSYVLVQSVFEENHYFTTVEQPPDAAKA